MNSDDPAIRRYLLENYLATANTVKPDPRGRHPGQERLHRLVPQRSRRPSRWLRSRPTRPPM
ncbi:hypothetical protein ACRAWD_02270 [Caulobacter segnis]